MSASKKDPSDELATVMTGGKAADVAKFFDGMPEPARRSLYPKVAKAYQAALRELYLLESPRRPGDRERIYRNCRTAMFETATARELHAADISIDEDAGEIELLAGRGAQRIQELLHLDIEDSYHAVWKIREEMAKGRCEAPVHPNWILGHMWWFMNRGNKKLANSLRDHPDWLADELWQMLELEGTADCNLAGTDKYRKGKQSWAEALKELSDDGTIDRTRLLDLSLDVLARDYISFRAGWYSRFHEHMEPTPDERAQRVDRYVLLLGSANPPTVTFAAKALTALDKTHPLDSQTVIDSVEPLLGHKAKATARLGLKLLSSAAKRASERSQAAAMVATRGLLHDAVDVQKGAMQLLQDLVPAPGDADPELRDAVLASREGLQPSLLPLLQPWNVTDSDTQAAESPDDLSSLAGAATEEVLPIGTVDELLLELSAVMESAKDPIAVERVLDGIARLGPQMPALDAQAKRAAKLVERLGEDEFQDPVQMNLCQFVIAWHQGKTFRGISYVRDKWYGRSQTHFLIRLLDELASQRDTAHQRLSTPTDTRGRIAPHVLVDRAKAAARTNTADQVLALLRLAGTPRTTALRKAAASIEGEFGSALRHALGEDGMQPGSTQALWIAAARARHPHMDDDALAEHLPDTGPGGVVFGTSTFQAGKGKHPVQMLVVTPEPPKKVPDLQPTVLFLSETKSRFYQYNVTGTTESLVRWSALLCPSNLEAYFAHGYQRLDVDWSGVQWEVRHFFEPMLFADCELGANAHRLLGIGLAAKESGQWGMAVDATVTAIADERLDVERLGSAMGELLCTGIVLAGRWARSLEEVARVSTAHRRAAFGAAVRGLRGDPGKAPKDIAKLLEFLHESSIALGTKVTDADARTFLEGLTGGGKKAKLQKALLQ